jgi:aryl-alcohol dehydrogenase-like predicted oxidoreductase
MLQLLEEGKIRFLGLSEARPEDIRRAAAVAPIATIQSEYSLFERSVEADVLPTCTELGIGFLAYAPLGRGLLAGSFRPERGADAADLRRTGLYPRLVGENLKRNRELQHELEALAAARSATCAQVALAWLLARPPGVVPIPGTRRTTHLEQNVAAASLTLTAAELERLDQLVPAGGGAAGQRYVTEQMPTWVSAEKPDAHSQRGDGAGHADPAEP